MRRILIIAAVFAAVVSCAKKEVSAPVTEPSSDLHEVSLVATAAETKTLLSDNSVIWEKTDKIRLRFEKSGLFHIEDFTLDGEGGETTAKFKGAIPTALNTTWGYSDDVYAVYPNSVMDPVAGTVNFSLSATRYASPGSFPSGQNLTSAKISLDGLNGANVENALFMNAFAIVRFVVPEHVTSLKITGTDYFAGTADFSFDADGRLVAESWSEGQESVIVMPESTPCFLPGEVYNILVYPGTHESLLVELTHDDDCKLEKEIDLKGESFVFEAAKFYTFDIKSEFMLDYSVVLDGPAFDEGSIVRAVFPGYTQEMKYIGTKSAAIFSGKLPGSLVHSQTPVEGYAIYPSSAYEDGVIVYDLSATGDAPELWSAGLSVSDLVSDEVVLQMNSVEELLSTISFNVPEGVESIVIEANKPLVGRIQMDVVDGKLVPLAPADSEIIELDSVETGECKLTIFPVSGVDLTFTLTDEYGSELVLVFEDFSVEKGMTEEIHIDEDLDFDKNTSFGNEGFESGGDNIEI